MYVLSANIVTLVSHKFPDNLKSRMPLTLDTVFYDGDKPAIARHQ